MPDLGKFLDAFGVHEGLHLEGYILASIHAKKSSSRSSRYIYPMTLTFYDERPNNRANADSLLHAILGQTRGTRYLTSSYGNSYRCDFGAARFAQNQSPDFPRRVLIVSEGTAVREN